MFSGRAKQPLTDRVDALKTDKERRFYALSLRADLAALIEEGLQKTGKTQRELAAIAGYKSESYISRLINAATNFKIGVAARVLVPLGITPRLVDEAEWDRLQQIASQERTAGVEPNVGRDDYLPTVPIAGSEATDPTWDRSRVTYRPIRHGEGRSSRRRSHDRFVVLPGDSGR